MGECAYVLPKGAPPLPRGLRFQSWVLFDVDSGTVLAARDPHARLRPASLAKMLLALTVARTLDRKQVVVGTRADANIEGTRVGIGPGGHYTVDQLLHGLLMHSGNDIAHAFARTLGGREQALRKENALARKFGAMDTHIASPSGLDAPGMCTSAYDLALIFNRLLHDDYLASIIHTQQFPFPGYGKKSGFVVYNDNDLLGSYAGDLGGKTGYTNDATHTFANAATRHGDTVGLIMMHNDNHLAGMYRNALALMDYGFTLASRDLPAVGKLVNGPPAARQQATTAKDEAVAVSGQQQPTGNSNTEVLIAALVLVIVVLSGTAGWWWRQHRRQ